MARRRKWTNVIINLTIAAMSAFNLVRHAASLISKDARLAAKNMMMYAVIFFLSYSLMTFVLASLFAVIFTIFISFKLSVMMSLFIVLFINVICLALILFKISKLQKRIFFPKTRRQLSALFS